MTAKKGKQRRQKNWKKGRTSIPYPLTLGTSLPSFTSSSSSSSSSFSPNPFSSAFSPDPAASESLVRWKNKKKDYVKPIPRRASRLGCRRLQAKARRYLPVLQQHCLFFQQVTATVINKQSYSNTINTHSSVGIPEILKKPGNQIECQFPRSEK